MQNLTRGSTTPLRVVIKLRTERVSPKTGKPMQGIIKKLTDRGFGFIGVEGQEKDLFFHSKSLVGVEYDELREGDAVTFEVENSPKGPSAVNVKRFVPGQQQQA